MQWPKVSKQLLEYCNGNLPKYSYVGLYPLYYILPDPYETGNKHESTLLCRDCATKETDRRKLEMYYDCNYEDPQMYCDGCGERIESAYAEKEA